MPSPSVTTWTRLEPRSRVADLSPGLEARTADPLWMLGRQWQLGELRGDDAGSPVLTRVRAHADVLTRFRTARSPATDLPAGQPLETFVERETADLVADLRLALDLGRELVARLRSAGLGAAVAPLSAAYRPHARPGAVVDAATTALLAATRGRIPDGLDLRSAVAEADGLPAGVVVPVAIAGAVSAALVAWASSAPLLSVGAPDEDAWQDARLEYSFDVAAAGPTGETVLRADGYDGNRLDWWDFDVAPGETLDAVASDATTESIVRTLLPAPATFAGMPSARWWEMEDSRISFGRITAERPDLARMLLVEFASVYGNDHFVVPIDVPVGSLVRVDSVVVTDTFGERFLIEPASAPARWGLYRPSRPDGGSEAVLVVLPTVVDTLHSRPLEETVLLRDEMANLVWGVESTVASAVGRPLDRLSEAARAATTPAPPVGSSELVYRLQSVVPEHWIPFVPVEHAPGVMHLRRSLQQRSGPGGTEAVLPQGQLLAQDGLEIPEEQVPRAGVSVTREWQSSRWVDGSTHVWLGRVKRTGRGPGSSGLVHDEADVRRTPSS
jgi:hypothetical protein